MKLTINAKDLSSALTEAKRYVYGKHTIPVLQCCKLVADDNAVSLTVTDLETAVTIRLAAEVAESGTAIVSVASLTSAIKGCNGTISLAYFHTVTTTEIEGIQTETISDGKVTVAGATIPADISPDCFPEIHTFTGSTEDIPLPCDIPVADLQTLIHRTVACISKEESRFTLNGALFLGAPTGLTMVATDGHRLAKAEVPGFYAPFKVLLPKFLIGELAKLKARTVSFASDADHVYFTTAGRSIVARKLTGNFPDYERVIPKEPGPNVLWVSRAQLLAAAGRVFELKRAERLPGLILHVNGSTAIESRGDIAFSATLPDAHYLGTELEFGCNSAYLVDALKASTADVVELRMTDVKSVMVMSEPGYQHLIMPIRL